jgi:hypothetical protein
MKVYIGPYRDWIGPYQIAEKLLFWMDKNKDSRVHNFGEWLAKSDTLCRICEWTYSKKKRKTKIRIDKYDTWNMNHTLALLVLPMLIQLKATKHGSPYTDDEDVPEHLRSNADRIKMGDPDIRETEIWDPDDTIHVRWNWVMDEMIYAFEMELDEEWEMEIYKREPEGWDDEKFAERKVINDRIQNGFRLFGKYYRGLWD